MNQTELITTLLFLAANPTVSNRLRLDIEVRDIERKMRGTPRSLRLQVRWAVTLDDLLQGLLEERPTAVHFSGHGAPDAIELEGKDGQRKSISQESLVQLFRVLKDNVRLVVLNVCYSETHARALATVIDCVVGMKATIDDTSARIFASAFYHALAFGRSVSDAFELGKLALMVEDIDRARLPRLIVRDGVDPNAVFLAV